MPHTIQRTFWQIAIPMIIIMLADQAFAMIDFWFISQILSPIYSNQDYITAISITFPIFFIVIAFAISLSTATGNLVSYYSWKKDHETKTFYFNYNILISLIIAFFLFIFWENIINYGLSLFELSNNVKTLAYDYLIIIFKWSIFLFLFDIFTTLLSINQAYKVQISLAILSLVLAIFLDYIFIFILDLWIKWWANATILTWIISFIFLIIYSLYKKYYVFNLNILSSFFKKAKNINILKKYSAYFIPALISNLLVMIEFMISNKFIANFGENAIAWYWIGFKLQPILIMVYISFMVTLMIMYWMLMWEKNKPKIIALEKFYLKISIITSIFLSILIFSLSFYFPYFFTDNLEIISIAKKYIYIMSLVFLILPYIFWIITILQSTWSWVWRTIQTILFLVIYIILLNIFSYTLGYTLFSYFIAHFINLVIFIPIVLKIRKDKMLNF